MPPSYHAAFRPLPALAVYQPARSIAAGREKLPLRACIVLGDLLRQMHRNAPTLDSLHQCGRTAFAHDASAADHSWADADALGCLGLRASGKFAA
jgi:hypothetical protein